MRTRLFGALAALALTACVHRTPPVTTTARASAEFAGTYALVAIDGHVIPYVPQHEGTAGPEVISSTLTMRTDGSFSALMTYRVVQSGSPRTVDRAFSGMYIPEGEDCVMTWDNAGQTPGSLRGDTFTMRNEGMAFTYRRLYTRPEATP